MASNPTLEPYIEKDYDIDFKLSIFESFLLIFIAELGDKTFIMLFLYFSLFSLITCSTLINPIPLKAHDRVFFSLTPESNYIIYSYQNDMPDSSYDLIIRLFNTPRYQTMIYVYYSVILFSPVKTLNKEYKCLKEPWKQRVGFWGRLVKGLVIRSVKLTD